MTRRRRIRRKMRERRKKRIGKDYGRRRRNGSRNRRRGKGGSCVRERKASVNGPYLEGLECCEVSPGPATGRRRVRCAPN